MSFTAGLEAVLTAIVEDLINGEPGSNKDYGISRYQNELAAGHRGSAWEVLAFMNDKAESLTNSEYSVVFADSQNALAPNMSGLFFAYVPKGATVISPRSRYFALIPDLNMVFLSDRAFTTKPDISDRYAKISARINQYDEEGKRLADSLVDQVREHVRVALVELRIILTDEQLSDLMAVAWVDPLDEGFDQLLKQVERIDLEQLFTLLVIVGQGDVPSHIFPNSPPALPRAAGNA